MLLNFKHIRMSVMTLRKTDYEFGSSPGSVFLAVGTFWFALIYLTELSHVLAFYFFQCDRKHWDQWQKAEEGPRWRLRRCDPWIDFSFCWGQTSCCEFGVRECRMFLLWFPHHVCFQASTLWTVVLLSVVLKRKRHFYFPSREPGELNALERSHFAWTRSIMWLPLVPGSIFCFIHMIMRVRGWGDSHVQCETWPFVSVWLRLQRQGSEVKLNWAGIPQWVWPQAGLSNWTEEASVLLSVSSSVPCVAGGVGLADQRLRGNQAISSSLRSSRREALWSIPPV